MPVPRPELIAGRLISIRLFLACLLLAIVSCTVQTVFGTVLESPEYKAMQQSWIECTVVQAERYISADPDPRNIATAVESACSTHTNKMISLFIERGVEVETFEPLIRGLKKTTRRTVIQHVLERRAKLSERQKKAPGTAPRRLTGSGFIVSAEGLDAGEAAYNRGDYATALREFQALAEQGDARAQYVLGFLYSEGTGVSQNHHKAMKWYRKAAEQDYALAQLMLGNVFFSGEGAPQNYVEGLKWFRLAANKGIADAQYALGTAYFAGEGVPQDDSKAVKWFGLAAKQGMAHAQRDLGFMYSMGLGVPQDKAKAVQWYRLAAEQGEPHAQYRLAGNYRSGIGVLQDYVQAHMWFNISAAGFPPGEWRDSAVTRRDNLSKQMTPAQIAEAQAMAREWTKHRKQEKK